MKEYKVTIKETLEKEVTVEAESQLEAEQLVGDRWRDGEYILYAEDFSKVDFIAEDMTPIKELSYAELFSLFSRVNDRNLEPVEGYIRFTESSFDKPYNAESRTYVVSSSNKAFAHGMGGFSIYASCLDGSDSGVRIDAYMYGDDAWKIEKCYMLKDDYEKLQAELDRLSKASKDKDER